MIPRKPSSAFVNSGSHQMRLFSASIRFFKENRIQVIAGDVGGGFGQNSPLIANFYCARIYPDRKTHQVV